jgi:hypothetical protein
VILPVRLRSEAVDCALVYLWPEALPAAVARPLSAAVLLTIFLRGIASNSTESTAKGQR